MARPLMQHGVRQLEDMFAKGKADPKALEQLESELQYRQVPRAVALLAQVQAAMYGGATQVPAAPAPIPARSPAPAPVSQQPDLWGQPVAPPVVAQSAGPDTATPVRKAPEPSHAPKAPPASAPTMPLDEAYKVLKATPEATWESLEQTRRTLVLQSHPSRWKTLSMEKRALTLSEAIRVNAAYAALSQARCAGR